jgi:hypothetical protein
MCDNIKIDWDSAYNNTKTIVSYNKYLGVKDYTKGCKTCSSTKYKEATDYRQLIGNCYQRIVVCECNSTFIEEWKQ